MAALDQLIETGILLSVLSRPFVDPVLQESASGAPVDLMQLCQEHDMAFRNYNISVQHVP